ncbi:MAG TPA: fumarate hydratase [Methylomusa anaerophila]|uniref:L(+)-tartrate dehydratase subunit alpha n=1 Tax=Methylomusa anaerophila TaxID=1930071 RepID=A0A348ALP5_9FIRM|nr:fumarate hydratase [Methylomusa anaerophila]BBB91993.1 L(+)-tartrate dehydratase subunit alpha [Methylomusa anaerophila]HML87994.1 fumarate hydratase [Methylomusa anaerophila]
MRPIDVEQITQVLAKMCMDVAYYLPKDIYDALARGQQTEESPLGRDILGQIVKNADIARNEDRPMCQDTGMAIVFMEIGQDVHFIGGNLAEAVNRGIAQGYIEGYLRKSVVGEPLFNRKNTGDNTPAVLYTSIVPGDKVKIKLAAKGFGSENKGGVKMLVPADGVEGVKKAVLEIILHAGENPCPPIVVGIGIGGTMDKAAVLSKQALLRPITKRNEHPAYAQLEEELLTLINKTGIGPQLGGTTTALGVNIEWYPTHIAGLPVAVTISCHATRHAEIEL